MTSSNRTRESFAPYTVIPENGVIAFYFYFFPHEPDVFMDYAKRPSTSEFRKDVLVNGSDKEPYESNKGSRGF